MFGVNSWIAQWIPDCLSGRQKARLSNVLRRTRGTDSVVDTDADIEL